MTILAAILIFCLLILSHEFGHFIMARLTGIYVYDFSLGMGPKLFSIKGKETSYTLRLFPIGGQCLMMGEDENSDDPRAFNKKKVWQRILVIAGGPMMNFLTAILIFIGLYSVIGIPYLSNEVGSLIEGQAAEAAGVLPGDKIIEINGQPISVWSEISPALALGEPGQSVDVVVERQGQALTLTILPTFEEESERWLLGVYSSEKAEYVHKNIFSTIGFGVQQSYLFTKQLLSALVDMIAGRIEPDISGPVGLVTVISEATHYGMQSLLLITAFLCMNLGVINLLPIPALDGARIVFLLVEGLRGRPLKPEREGMVHFVGLMLLFALMIVLTFNDIARLVGS